MDWLIGRFAQAPGNAAFIHQDRTVTYAGVIASIESFSAQIRKTGIQPGERVVVLGDYAPEVFCLFFALALNRNIIVPLTRESVVEEEIALGVCGCDWFVEFSDSGIGAGIRRRDIAAESALLTEFRRKGNPGLVLFSSGSTGKPKGILYDFTRIAEKFRKQREPVIAIPFLMIDHFGGINTILAITSSLGTAVTVADRSVPSICRAIDKYKVELLPTTPSFLTMLMASRLHHQFDLSSLKRISYGTEVMPQSTLNRVRAAFPHAELLQTYGLSEVGVLRSQSRPDGSLWVRLGGPGFQTQVRDDILWIKSDFAMEGYLNAPSEFDGEGWFNTRDRVEVDGDYFRILGRTTDIINVGGQKVYPAEVEDFLLQLDNILDVAVYGEPSPLLGQLVVARVQLETPEPADQLKRRIRQACVGHLTPFKIPGKVVVSQEPLYSARQKKLRTAAVNQE
ncbi:MAG: AMP-dependent synthetase and ligase [Polaromonas sp.]|nr:AMP-dependent synthetase and ligase [Polaromonas sp.]